MEATLVIVLPSHSSQFLGKNPKSQHFCHSGFGIVLVWHIVNPIWALEKSDWNGISNHLKMWMGYDMQKSDFFAVQIQLGQSDAKYWICTGRLNIPYAVGVSRTNIAGLLAGVG